jgi:hypothetical protein
MGKPGQWRDDCAMNFNQLKISSQLMLGFDCMAALVEEMAAATSALKAQAKELVQTVAVFVLPAQRIADSASNMPPAVRAPVSNHLPFHGTEKRHSMHRGNAGLISSAA